MPSKTAINWLFSDIMLFIQCLFWLKNWLFSTNICKGLLYTSLTRNFGKVMFLRNLWKSVRQKAHPCTVRTKTQLGVCGFFVKGFLSWKDLYERYLFSLFHMLKLCISYLEIVKMSQTSQKLELREKAK